MREKVRVAIRGANRSALTIPDNDLLEIANVERARSERARASTIKPDPKASSSHRHRATEVEVILTSSRASKIDGFPVVRVEQIAGRIGSTNHAHLSAELN